jgi:hypothetical protein
MVMWKVILKTIVKIELNDVIDPHQVVPGLFFVVEEACFVIYCINSKVEPVPHFTYQAKSKTYLFGAR